MKTITEEIYNYLKLHSKKWKSGGELERILSSYHKPSTVGRVLRALAEEDKIYKDYRNDNRIRYVIYKYKKV